MIRKRETEMFCAKRNGYRSFMPDVRAARAHGEDPKCIVRVRVREAREDEASTHYAWWDNERKTFPSSFVWGSRVQVEICFTYGTDVLVREGKGELCAVVVEEIGN